MILCVLCLCLCVCVALFYMCVYVLRNCVCVCVCARVRACTAVCSSPNPTSQPRTGLPPGRPRLACRPRLRCQNWQSAAPPAMVPSRYLLISITFLTVWDAADGGGEGGGG